MYWARLKLQPGKWQVSGSSFADFPGCISGDLGQKQDVTWHPHAMLATQVAALCAMPQHGPLAI